MKTLIDKEILKRAVEIEIEGFDPDIARSKRMGYETEIILVPVAVELNSDKNIIGCITHSGIMNTYNDIVRGYKS